MHDVTRARPVNSSPFISPPGSSERAITHVVNLSADLDLRRAVGGAQTVRARSDSGAVAGFTTIVGGHPESTRRRSAGSARDGWTWCSSRSEVDVVTVVSTDGLEVKDREAFWRQAIAETFVPALVGDAGHGQLGGSIRSTWMGQLMVAEVSASAQDIRRTPRLIRQADAEYFQVARVTRGVGRLTQDGREAVLRPGDFAAYETTRPFQWSFGADWDVSVFTFPCSAVQLTEPERRLLTARRMAGAGGMTGMVSRFLRDLGANTSLISATHSERLAAQASDLIITLLSECGHEGEAVRSSAQRSLLLRIKDQIAQRLTDPGLGPAEIAAAGNVSVRYLHKLFSSEELSVSEYVKQARLERCRRDLLDPRRARESIASIASRSGFGDLSGFNRAFKSRFGLTPRDLRGRFDGPSAE